jgi:hypothetical protein
VPLSLYLHHFYIREKRAEKPHLLAGFSPVLGFPGHILCLFVDGVCIYLCSLFFTFELFHMFFLRRKSVIKSLRSKGKITLIVKISVIYQICCDELFQWNIHISLQIIGSPTRSLVTCRVYCAHSGLGSRSTLACSCTSESNSEI